MTWGQEKSSWKSPKVCFMKEKNGLDFIKIKSYRLGENIGKLYIQEKTSPEHKKKSQC